MTTLEFYTSELESKRTTASKKAFLTRSESQVLEHLQELETAKKYTGQRFAYLHGEAVTPIRITNVKVELQVIRNLRKSL